MESDDAAFLASVDEFLQTSCEELELPLSLESKVDNLSFVKAVRVLKDRQRRRALRDRQKAERERLTSQVKELSALLEAMKKPKTIGTQQNLLASWKTIARWNLEARLRAESKRRVLREAVESRAKLIRELNSTITKGVSCNELLEDHPTSGTLSLFDSFDKELNAVYTRELDAVYAQTDQILLDCEGDSGFGTTWRKDARKRYFEYADKRVLPTEYHQTCHMLWLASHKLEHQDNRKDYDGLANPDNTMAVKFRIRTALKSGRQVSVTQQAVSRRYEEKDRIVIVWRSLVEGEGRFEGMHYDETGWLVAKRSNASTNSGTDLGMCVRNIPMHLGKDSLTVDQFTEVVLGMKSDSYAEIERLVKSVSSRSANAARC